MTCGKGYSSSCPEWDWWETYVSPYIRVTNLNGTVITQAKQGDTVRLQCRVKKYGGHTCDNIYGQWFRQVQAKTGLINTIKDYTYSGTGEWLTCEWTIPDNEPAGTYQHFGYYVMPDEWLFEMPFTILAGGAEIRVTGPGSHDFGEEFIGQYSTQMQWAIYNDGNTTANVSVTLDGINVSDFSCPNCGQHAIAPGGSIGIIVRFYPQSEGEKEVILNILCSDCELGHQGTLIMLYGKGVTAVEDMEVVGPLSKNFGQTAVNSCSNEQAYEVKNIGTLDTIIQFNFIDFEQFECNNCTSVSIPVGQSHFFSVKHCPTNEGNHGGVVEVFNVNIKYVLSFEGQGVEVQLPVTCWRCNGEIPESQEFAHGTVCGLGSAIGYPYLSMPNCVEPTNCSAQTNQADCEANNCHWYAKLPWEEPQCWDGEQDLIKDNLPLILIGGGVIVLLMSG